MGRWIRTGMCWTQWYSFYKNSLNNNKKYYMNTLECLSVAGGAPKETGIWRLRDYIKIFRIFVIGQLHVWSVCVACSYFSWSGSDGLVSKSCPTLCEPTGCSPPGSSVHGFLQARILEWVDLSSSKGSSWPRDGTPISCRADGFFTIWATGEGQNALNLNQEMSCGGLRTISWGCGINAIHNTCDLERKTREGMWRRRSPTFSSEVVSGQEVISNAICDVCTLKHHLQWIQ